MILPIEPKAEPDATSSEEASHLSITIAYQSVKCHQRALRTYESVAARLSAEYQFTPSVWKFDLFQFQNMRTLAVEDAIEADILIVCASQVESIDDGFYQWLAEWSGGKTNKPSAIVALFAGSEDDSLSGNKLKTRLEAVAKDVGMSFFSENVRSDETADDPNARVSTFSVC